MQAGGSDDDSEAHAMAVARMSLEVRL